MNERAIFPSISISLFCSHLVALLMKCLAIVFLSSWNCEWKLKNKSQQFFDNLFFQMPGSSLFCGCKAKANEFTWPCIFWIHGNWVGENEKKIHKGIVFCIFVFSSLCPINLKIFQIKRSIWKQSICLIVLIWIDFRRGALHFKESLSGKCSHISLAN